MKKYLAVFVAVTVLTSAAALAEEKFNAKRCFKECMKKLDDAETCTYICYDSQKDEKK